ncbi:transporter substrate-binding domain-containing protein [Thiospirochaeta perfilievii]|uniref:Transporter substrate-binding domain-containing protein n=1 Tax=Thiospirochaeta perfilievii TaxID=252967 RepID=A0A5C1Q8G4_9SPIO|nr:transporter substrate-binding domain-containing protein [Thiospirochaeta perfilievii]
MPKVVGLYLAKEMGLEVKVLYAPDPGSPVCVAVPKGNYDMIKKVNIALDELILDGEIDKIYNKWF